MLISCPKCGFSQPNDQYCAQCGVDMQSFKQKKQPTMNRIFNNALVQICVLLVLAVLIGQFIFRNQEPQRWVQKLAPFQIQNNLNKSTNLVRNDSNDSSNDIVNDSAEEEKEEKDLLAKKQPELNNSRENFVPPPPVHLNSDSNLARSQVNQNTPVGNQDLNSINFKMTYAEVTQDILTKWIAESSELGLYQNLSEYSAGIIYDFKKRGDTFHQTLKSANIKLNVGGANSNLSGTMTNDGNQMLGLVTVVEYKSNENEVIHGNINITKNNAQGSETYPAEFNLPKGAVFYLIGSMKRENFAQERSTLTMPPFQIFKSPDFMTRKTEFVIIIEPDYK